MPACWGVRSALRLLHATHASTQFVHIDVPPAARAERGRSSVPRSPAACRSTDTCSGRA
jgi:hypothetical protein